MVFFGSNFGWLDKDHVWYQSESTGYSHLYIHSISTNTNKALTKGNYEVINAKLSNDKKSFYITTNEIHPGEQHFYKLSISGVRLPK
jgi:SET domain-containing protein